MAQVPPYHIRFTQAESFLVKAGAIGTTSTHDMIDTVHTTATDFSQKTPRPGLSPAIPSRRADGATTILPWTPHTLWP
jgi:hypothetical protein